jgi:hypothetical protein
MSSSLRSSAISPARAVMDATRAAFNLLGLGDVRRSIAFNGNCSWWLPVIFCWCVLNLNRNEVKHWP